jgi:glycosyltransferase involved in cell wall biosynthesis
MNTVATANEMTVGGLGAAVDWPASVVSPVLTIVVPVYNAQTTISRIVEKILHRDYRDFELILVDDGSTDDSLALMRELSEDDSRVRIFSQSNSGPAAARNLGLSQARGEYLMFIDSDDDFSGAIFTTMVETIERKHSDMVVCSYDRVESSGSHDPQIFTPRTIARDPQDPEEFPAQILESLGSSGALYNLWGKIYRTSIIRSNDLRFRDDLRFGEDLLFNLDYYLHASAIDFIDAILYFYHVGDGEFSQNSLNYAFRQANQQALEAYVAGECSGKATDGQGVTSRRVLDLKNWLLFRWQISFTLLICSSSLGYSDKIALARYVRDDKLTRAVSAKYIGAKKFMMEVVFDFLRKWPRLLLGVLGFLSALR